MNFALHAHMTFQKISDEVLLEQTKKKVREEKLLTTEIMQHLKEIERRQLFLKMGFPSLFAYCVEELGYSEGSAFRRISSMRLISDVPLAEEKLERGAVNVSTLSQLQRFIRKEERFTGKKMDNQEKEELLARIENKSQQEVEREFASISPHIVLSSERQRPITSDLTEVKIVIDAKLLKKLEKLRSLLSHRKPNASFAELIDLMADISLRKLEPQNPAAKNPASEKTEPRKLEPRNPARENPGPGNPAPRNPKPWNSKPEGPEFKKPEIKSSEPKGPWHGRPELESPVVNNKRTWRNNRYIPSEYRKRIWLRDGGKCTYVSSTTGRRCNSKNQLQIDHIIPVCGGGKSDLENLRLLCSAHNRWKGNRFPLTDFNSDAFVKSE